MPDIPEIKARYEAATTGPWRCLPLKNPTDNHCIEAPTVPMLAFFLHGSYANDSSGADAEFVAHARTDIPQLVQALEEARGTLTSIGGRLLEIVEECEEVGMDPSYLFSMLDAIDPKILERQRPKGESQ